MIKVTLAIPPGAPVDSGPTLKYYPDHAALVCVEKSPGVYAAKRVDALVVEDKLCMFGPPRPGPGAEITLVEVE